MELRELTKEMNQFVASQGWYDPDTPKVQSERNLAISLSIEAAEVLELYQWREGDVDLEALGGELADVLLYLLQLANTAGIDLESAALAKLKQNYGRTWGERKGEGEG
jgi:NTP pyrophosphatase (non-canonical NTP hydrolase)